MSICCCRTGNTFLLSKRAWYGIWMSRCYSFRNAFYPPIRPEPLGPSGATRSVRSPCGTEGLFAVKVVKKAVQLKLKLLNMILIHHDLIYFYLMEHRGISGDFFMIHWPTSPRLSGFLPSSYIFQLKLHYSIFLEIPVRWDKQDKEWIWRVNGKISRNLCIFLSGYKNFSHMVAL